MNLNILAAIFLGVLGASLGLRHILVAPAQRGFPTEQPIMRAVMFCMALAVAAVSVMFFVYGLKSPGLFAGAATVPLLVVFGLFALYGLGMTWQVIYPRTFSRNAPTILSFRPKQPSIAEPPYDGRRLAVRAAHRRH